VRGLAVIALAACAAGEPAPGEEAGQAIARIEPATVVPGTTLIVTGAFDDGALALHLAGAELDVTWPAVVIDATTLHVTVGPFAAGDFHGAATIERMSGGRTFVTPAAQVDLAFRTELAPAPTAIATGVAFVNDAIAVDGDGFLLGGGEGATTATLAGCVTPDGGGACAPVPDRALPVIAESRTRARFVLAPRVVGIRPGAFTGTVTIANELASGARLAAAPQPVRYDLIGPEVHAVAPAAASLGQYVFVDGGGFVAAGDDDRSAATELELVGTFRRAGGPARAVAMTLIPEPLTGRRARYVINPDDELGRALDLRRETGAFTGTLTPITSYAGARVRGTARPFSLEVAPIKQVVALEYRPSFVDGLRDFGLRAVDAQIRARIAATCAAAYAGVNLELRDGAPADFALYTDVELVGLDPNDQGLFGYDNSPGKDAGNLRLYDRLGGVNAQTQADGFAGYGGIFLRSLFGFSQHPGALARPTIGADPAFDQIFDPFRPDRGGAPVSSADLATALPDVTGADCPARDRPRQIACAIRVLGALVGGTLAHEVGHALGLADPAGDAFHDPGDAPNRLMDAGDARPFLERAELGGQGPAVFCTDEYAYLRQILPGAEPAAAIARPGCS
jgi:hypothetical protein